MTMLPGLSSHLQLGRWLSVSEWRAHPVRLLVAIGAIALGVALGFAIQLINAAAFNEFSAAVKSLSGQADLQVRSSLPVFDEQLYPRVAQREGVAVASPVLELDASVPGQSDSLKIIGLDIFQAAAISPDLVGVPAEDRTFDTLADDALFLSPAAMTWLGVKTGDTLSLRAGTATVSLRVAGGLTNARAGQRIAVMDLGAAQWRFNRLGVLSRLDLQLQRGVQREDFRKALARDLGSGFAVGETADQEQRTSNMSRAYRVNLNVLAMVALFTGAFLVFSTQALSVVRRRSQLALLRVMGLTRKQVLAQIIVEGAVLGSVGALIGLLVGYGIAALTLHFFGGDLGGGYFPGVQPRVQFSPLAALLFFALGTGVAILGCASPALEAARTRPGPALKAGSEETALNKLASPWPALIMLTLAAVLSQLPPVFALPIFGYLAVALLLIGGIALMPRLAALMFSLASRFSTPNPVQMLSLARLANAPNQASIALGGILSSFSLMVAMAIMVASFRVSVDDWLQQILAADLYLRSAPTGTASAFSFEEQQDIARAPGIARTEFLRVVQLSLDPTRATVALIAKPIDATDPGNSIPLIGAPLPNEKLPADAIPVWVSEPMVDLYGHRIGQRIQLPIGPSLRDCIVAGIWRDYGRQGGAIQMQLDDYRRLTGDREINDIGLWLAPGFTPTAMIETLRAKPFGATLEFAEPGEIREISLRIFDRSFAITYLLEGVAIVIGLFGVAATFSAQTLARVREFGMLRHIGLSRRQILGMLAAEGALLTLLGILVGFLLGFAISLILVFVVNPQSFHWTMRLHLPWELLASVAAVLLLSASMTALFAGRQAVSGSAVRAVREDW